ncbi:oocyte zinc finger protein XlCOF8.4-like [Dendropsophus ebraccatus]|uniref:oocyte zinc finger protein XlCOF8.4-like n=1 Tax=Dendropsophus ebraccatus TaxID=150705 RepID=UPI003831AC59
MMEKDRNEISKRILHVTLEIIRLLTGEDYTIVKKTWGEGVAFPQESGGRSRARGPITEPPSLIHEQKILELTHRMTELLTGEVPIRCQDVAVYFSMEEWEYVEGHKDLYRGEQPLMMEDQPPGLTAQDGGSDRNPPERCPRPLYSQDCPEGTHIKVEDEAEEERMRGDPPCMSEVKEEEAPGDAIPGNGSNNSEDMWRHFSGEAHHHTASVRPGRHTTRPSSNPPDLSLTNTWDDHRDQERLLCGICGEEFTNESSLHRHRRNHARKKLYSCLECGRCYIFKSYLVRHQRVHTGEKPYPCSECGKCFTTQSSLSRHERSHTGEKPHACSECEKCFTTHSSLVRHLRIHTGEKPYLCVECGKCFTDRPSLIKHQKSHTGLKPYICPECGKCFTDKTSLIKHMRIHKGEKPYSCSECWKCFRDKPSLAIHARNHTGEKPYPSGSVNNFITKLKLRDHRSSHTGEEPV